MCLVHLLSSEEGEVGDNWSIQLFLKTYLPGSLVLPPPLFQKDFFELSVSAIAPVGRPADHENCNLKEQTKHIKIGVMPAKF